MERYAVIMAGGVGSRLWPLSRECKPKQFISPNGNKCMLVQTIERISKVIPAEKCSVVTNRSLFEITQDTIMDLIPLSNIIAEPSRKNTAACIAYASLLLKKMFGSGILSFIPADGYVRDHEKYIEAIKLAYSAAESTGNLVIVGINPAYPAIGYGYIYTGPNTDIDADLSKVIQFVEKPDLETARKFVASGEFLWNSGIVLGEMDAIIGNIKLFLPDHYNKMYEAVEHIGEKDFYSYIEKAYDEIQDISFDKGVLEKSKDTVVVRGFFDWDDIGSIDALSRVLSMDAKGNSVKGNHFGIDTSNSVIYGDDILIATIGINNMIIASTNDAIIICPRDRAQDIKFLVEQLKINGYGRFI